MPQCGHRFEAPRRRAAQIVAPPRGASVDKPDHCTPVSVMSKMSVAFGGIGERPCEPVREIGRNDQTALSAHLHADDALIPAGDHAGPRPA